MCGQGRTRERYQKFARRCARSRFVGAYPDGRVCRRDERESAGSTSLSTKTDHRAPPRSRRPIDSPLARTTEYVARQSLTVVLPSVLFVLPDRKSLWRAHLKRTGLRTARQLLLVGALLTYPIWDLPLKRRVDPQMERIELAVKAERTARSTGPLIRTPSGERRRAVVYTPGDPSGLTTTSRYLTWLFRALALMIVLQMLLGSRALGGSYARAR
jgi:hypothetical protein